MRKLIRAIIILVLAIVIGVVVRNILGQYGIGVAAGICVSAYEIFIMKD